MAVSYKKLWKLLIDKDMATLYRTVCFYVVTLIRDI